MFTVYMIIPDQWQKEVIQHKGNICVCSGRQTGKSQCIAIKAIEYVVNNKNKQVLIISVTEDQAIELLLKCINYVEEKFPRLVKRGKDRPTKSILRLTNGSMIRTKAVGQSGLGVRGFTINMLIADEAAFMPKDVWAAVTPMLLTTGGDIILISTPHGKTGYFYDCYNDPNFKTWHLNSEQVIKDRKISPSWNNIQKIKALEHLESEKLRMSTREYGQEYLGLFLEDLAQFYPDELIRASMIQQRQDIGKQGRIFYLGVDVARMGEDHTAFQIIERRDQLLIHRESIVWKKNYLPEISEKIIALNEIYNFKKIYVDSGGLGIGVVDNLLADIRTKRKTIGLDNSEKLIEYNSEGKPRMKKLLGVDLHNNLLNLMQKKKILILDDGDIYQSFKSVQYEYINEKGGAVMRVFSEPHKDGDIIEALKRAAFCIKDKINKVRFSYI